MDAGAVLVSEGGCVFMPKGREMMPASSFVLEGSPREISLGHALGLVNNSASYMHQAFFKLLFLCYISMGLFVVLSL